MTFKKEKLAQNKNGFTIVELMIATVVFSVILLIITTGIIQIGKSYYKGIISARTQETARKIIDEVGRNLQFNRDGYVYNVTSGSDVWVCVGGTHYKSTTAPSTTLERFSTSSATACGSISGSGQQLLPPGVRLLEFSVSCITDSPLCNIKVTAGTGEDDILDTAAKTCRSGAGSQYCAVSNLETSVNTRLSH